MAESNKRNPREGLEPKGIGHGLALWVLRAVVLVKIAQGLMLLFANDYVERTADGIPLDACSPGGARAKSVQRRS